MSVWGIAMVKDEVDIIATTVDHMLGQVDRVFVSDNGSTDGTREVLHERVRDGLYVQDDTEPGYYQSAKMSKLALLAAHQGADWVVPFDADELWVTKDGSTIAAALRRYAREWHGVVTAPILNHVATDEDPEGNPVERMGWRLRQEGELPKVACRPTLPVTIEQGNHGAHYPPADIADGVLLVHHYPYRSAEQTIRKTRNGAAAYRAAAEVAEDHGAHWRQHDTFTDDQLAHVFEDWWYWPDPASRPGTLLYDPCPT